MADDKQGASSQDGSARDRIAIGVARSVPPGDLARNWAYLPTYLGAIAEPVELRPRQASPHGAPESPSRTRRKRTPRAARAFAGPEPTHPIWLDLGRCEQGWTGVSARLPRSGPPIESLGC